MVTSNIEIKTFEDWRAANASKTRSKKQTYDPRIEKLPDVPWFRFNKMFVDAEVLGIYRDVTDTLIPKLRPQDLEISELKDATEDKKAAFFNEIITAKAVGIVGQQAMGKSLLINALLHRRQLSKTSAAGGACTAVAIKYVSKVGVPDDCDRYDAVVHFMDDTELQEIICEHGRRYYHFHHSQAVDPNWREEEERAAKTAEAFFALLWNARNDEQAAVELQRLLSAECVNNGELAEKAIEMAKRRIEGSGADANRKKEFRNLNAAALMEKTQSYIAQDDAQPSLWPIVSYNSIATGSVLLGSGVTLIDLPGFGDLNQSRTAATNSIRRKADLEIIVAKSDRVRTEEVVDAQIKQSIRAHGAKNTILVLTKIDEFFLDNHSIENIIETSADAPFPLIKDAMAATERAQIEAEEKQSMKMEVDGEDDDYEEDEELAAHIEAMCGYQEYLKKTAQCAFVQQRATMLETQMRCKYTDIDPEPIRVFSVSASQYLDWMKPRRHKDPILSAERTGIPQLRQFLMSVSAANHLANYRHHITVKLPEFLARIERVIHSENKNDAYAEIRPFFSECVERLKNHQTARFEGWLHEKLLRMWTISSERQRARDKVAEVVQKWGDGSKWNTYNKFLREMGIVKKSLAQKYKGLPANWNQEVSEAISSDFLSWRLKMRKEVAAISKELHRTVQNACDEVANSITHSNLPSALRDIALNDWTQRCAKVLRKSNSLGDLLRCALMEIYKYSTTETDTRCMVARVSAMVYISIQKMPMTEAWFSKQKAAMNEAMFPSSGKNLLDWIAEHHFNFARSILYDAFAMFMLELECELQMFDEQMGERLPPEYELTESDLGIRDELRVLLPGLKQRVAALEKLLPAEGDEADQIKREREDDELDNEDMETPAKRLRFTHLS